MLISSLLVVTFIVNNVNAAVTFDAPKKWYKRAEFCTLRGTSIATIPDLKSGHACLVHCAQTRNCGQYYWQGSQKTCYLYGEEATTVDSDLKSDKCFVPNAAAFDFFGNLTWIERKNRGFDVAHRCQFDNPDNRIATSTTAKPGKECIATCAETPRCTHYDWDKATQTCTYYQGDVTRDDGVIQPIMNKNHNRCFIMTGLQWEEARHVEKAFKCQWRDDETPLAQVDSVGGIKNCAYLCEDQEGCTHYHNKNGETCFLYGGEADKANAEFLPTVKPGWKNGCGILNDVIERESAEFNAYAAEFIPQCRAHDGDVKAAYCCWNENDVEVGNSDRNKNLADNSDQCDVAQQQKMHCHGTAWEAGKDINVVLADMDYIRNLDHRFNRGYVGQFGDLECGCAENMVAVTRADCTASDDGENFEACGNNDLLRYFNNLNGNEKKVIKSVGNLNVRCNKD